MREKFEEWAKQRGWDTTPAMQLHFTYADAFLERIWIGYQARQPEIDALEMALITEQTHNLELQAEAGSLTAKLVKANGLIENLRELREKDKAKIDLLNYKVESLENSLGFERAANDELLQKIETLKSENDYLKTIEWRYRWMEENLDNFDQLSFGGEK